MGHKDIVAVATGAVDAETSRSEAKLFLAPYADSAGTAAYPREDENTIVRTNAACPGAELDHFGRNGVGRQLERNAQLLR